MTALAGVTSALGPKVKSGCGAGSCVASLTGAAPAPRRRNRITVGGRDGEQVGPLRAGDGDVDEAADRQIVGQVHDAVDLGCLVHRAALAGCVDEDLPGGADQRVAPGGRDGVLQLGTLAEALERELGRHLLVESGGVGAVLAGVGEEAGPVELRRFEELEQAGRGRARSRPGSRG